MKVNKATVFSLVLSPGATWFGKKFSELENQLDVGEHSQVQRHSDTVYDKLRRDWEEKFHTVDKDEEIGSVPVAVGEERHEKNETGRSPQCSDLQTVTCRLDGLYTSPKTKLCIFQPRLNST